MSGEEDPGSCGPGVRGTGLVQLGQLGSRQEVPDVESGKEVPD